MYLAAGRGVTELKNGLDSQHINDEYIIRI
jgi:hypothetical protein